MINAIRSPSPEDDHETGVLHAPYEEIALDELLRLTRHLVALSRAILIVAALTLIAVMLLVVT